MALNRTHNVSLFFFTKWVGLQARGDHACVGLPARAEVLCIGGFTEADFEYTILRSVERFDFETEQWEDKADMVNPRADFGAG